jgi:hypothetical protein
VLFAFWAIDDVGFLHLSICFSLRTAHPNNFDKGAAARIQERLHFPRCGGEQGKHVGDVVVSFWFLGGHGGTLRCGGAFLNAGGDRGALAVVQCQSPKTQKWQRTGTTFG